MDLPHLTILRLVDWLLAPASNLGDSGYGNSSEVGEPGDEESGDGETTTEFESIAEPGSSDSDERPLGAFMNQLLDNIAYLQGVERPGLISRYIALKKYL